MIVRLACEAQHCRRDHDLSVELISPGIYDDTRRFVRLVHEYPNVRIEETKVPRKPLKAVFDRVRTDHQVIQQRTIDWCPQNELQSQVIDVSLLLSAREHQGAIAG